MENDKKFKILSIDGGGIKGLYSARVLNQYEEIFKCNMSEMFDMICGTSTGGIIALALSIGKRAEDIADLYFHKGPLIFPNGNRIISWLRKKQQVFLKSKYSNEVLKKELSNFFGQLKMEEAETLLCIPSYNLSNGMPRVFKFPHQEGGFTMDKGILMRDVAMATSAAPSILPVTEIANCFYIDGGIWANNPSLVALVEALQYYVGEGKEYSEVEILSIGNISQTVGAIPSTKKCRSIFDWKSDLVEVVMSGQSYSINFILSKFSSLNDIPVKYVRVESEKLSSEQYSIVGLDNTNKESLDLLSSQGERQGHVSAARDDVKCFFKTPKTYKTNGKL